VTPGAELCGIGSDGAATASRSVARLVVGGDALHGEAPHQGMSAGAGLPTIDQRPQARLSCAGYAGFGGGEGW
jgi:hypothetical protein